MNKIEERALCIFESNLNLLIVEAEEKLRIKIIFTYFYPGIPSGGGVSDEPSRIYVYETSVEDKSFLFFKWKKVVIKRSLLSIDLYDIYDSTLEFEILDADLLCEDFFLYIIKKNFDKCREELKAFRKKQIKY